MSSVVEQTPYNEYTGDGVATVYPYEFQLLSAADLVVTIDGVVIPSSDFVLSGVGVQSGGDVTFSVAPLNGADVLLSRVIALQRDVDYQYNGDLKEATVDGDFNRLWQALQGTGAILGGSIRVPFPEQVAALPGATDRANKLLAFNALGAPVLSVPISGSAAALALQLADPTVSTSAAGQVAYNSLLSYPPGSVGYALAQLALGFAYPDNLGKIATDLKAGTAVPIACFGDSTMWGADPANLGVQVAQTPPQALQDLLRKYFGNTAATVANNAISGTTSAQMLAGTDGSGSTFAAKMAVSTAQVVYCNHGRNDANGTVGNTTPAQYKANLITIVKTIRLFGKMPVLVTPNPNWPLVGRIQAWSEPVKLYAAIMRQVAAEYAVALVDNFDLVQRQLASGRVTTQALIPDGIHPSAATYAQIGRNLALPVVGQTRPFTAPDQFQAAAEGITQLTNASGIDTGGSRLGSYIGTLNTGGAQSLRFLLNVQEPGLDMYLACPVSDGQSDIVTIGIDGNYGINSFSQFHAGFSSAGAFIQDYETCFMEDVLPGLHLIELLCSSVAIGVYHVRSRAKLQPNTLKTSGSSMRYKKLWLDSVEHNATVGDAYLLFDEFPTSHMLRDFSCEWVSQMPKQSGVVLCGFTFSNNAGPQVPRAGFIVALDNVGNLTLYETSGPAAFIATTLGAVDLSLASHTYRVVLTTGRFGTVTVFVDNTAIGAPYAITRPFWGGRLGLWKFPNTGNLKIDKLYYLPAV